LEIGSNGDSIMLNIGGTEEHVLMLSDLNELLGLMGYVIVKDNGVSEPVKVYEATK
jgi:hypothetical protein